MNEENFAAGLEKLLERGGEIISPRPAFQAELLKDLKTRQRQQYPAAGAASGQTAKRLYIFSAIAAAAAIMLLLTPWASNSALSPNTAATAAHPASNTPPPEITASATTLAAHNRATSSKPLAQARAVTPLEIKNTAGAWQLVAAGVDFPLRDNLELRVPLGAVGSASFVLPDGQAALLDGYTRLALRQQTLQVLDGRAVFSLTSAQKPLRLKVAGQTLTLAPGAVAFVDTDNAADYAPGGAPAPRLAILAGQARTAQNQLAAGYIYELFDTQTGRFPSRAIGERETAARFMPMLRQAQKAANLVPREK